MTEKGRKFHTKGNQYFTKKKHKYKKKKADLQFTFNAGKMYDNLNGCQI